MGIWLLTWCVRLSRPVTPVKLLEKRVMPAEMARKIKKTRDSYQGNWHQPSLKMQRKMSFIWSKGILPVDQLNKVVIVNSRPFFPFEVRCSTLRKPKWQTFSKTKKSIPWFILSVLELELTLTLTILTTTRLSSWPMPIPMELTSRPCCSLSSIVICVHWLKQDMFISLCLLFTRCLKGKARRKLSNMLGLMGNLRNFVKNLVVELFSSVTRGLVRWMLTSFGKQLWIQRPERLSEWLLTT